MILTVTLNAAIDKRYVVDAFKAGEVNRVKECSYVPGGKGLNVSKPASIYGAEVVATGFVGGHAGNYIEDALKPFGIKGDFYHVPYCSQVLHCRFLSVCVLSVAKRFFPVFPGRNRSGVCALVSQGGLSSA